MSCADGLTLEWLSDDDCASLVIYPKLLIAGNARALLVYFRRLELLLNDELDAKAAPELIKLKCGEPTIRPRPYTAVLKKAMELS
jgi:hypothetical protein